MKKVRKIVFSCLIHDIGILYFDKNIDELLRNRENVEHAYLWYCLIEDYFPLDGKGYPFKLDKTKLSNGARILAVSDIFTALTEDRPYRKGFEKEMVIKILSDIAKKDQINKTIVELLINNYDKYNKLRDKSQEETMADYKVFKNNTAEEIDNIFYNKESYKNI